MTRSEIMIRWTAIVLVVSGVATAILLKFRSDESESHPDVGRRGSVSGFDGGTNSLAGPSPKRSDPAGDRIREKLKTMSAWRSANVNGFTLDASVAEVFELSDIQIEELNKAWTRLLDSSSRVDAESAVVVNIPIEAIRQGIEGAVSYQGICAPGREQSWEEIKSQFGDDLERIMGAERAGLFRSSADYAVRLLTGDFGRYPRFFRITTLGASAAAPFAFEVYGGQVAYEYANLNLLDWGDANGTEILSSLLHSKVPGRSVAYSPEVPAYMAGMVEMSGEQKPGNVRTE